MIFDILLTPFYFSYTRSSFQLGRHALKGYESALATSPPGAARKLLGALEGEKLLSKSVF